MLIRDGLRIHLMKVLPKRKFSLLIDPECLLDLASNSYSIVLQLVIDLGLHNPSVRLTLLTPEKRGLGESLFELIPNQEKPEPFSPANLHVDDPRQRLLADDAPAIHMRNLCALARHLKVDGIVTTSSNLIEARYDLQHDLVTIVPLDELGDFVEVCAHGHDVFWSASYEDALTHDVYYTLAHYKCQKLVNWWSKAQSKITSNEIERQLRSLIFNRYPFILYARDMVRFFRLQRDHFTRLGEDRFALSLSYHANAFYLLVWGMLDQLSLIANHVFALGLSQMACGISHKKFMDALESKKRNLWKFIQTPMVQDWIDVMSDFRHSVAHQVIPMPTSMVVETEESIKPREEILKVIELEDQNMANILHLPWSPELTTSFEDTIISQWRAQKMKRIADHMVQLKGKRGEYFRSPVVSIDYDLGNVTGIMDAFLIGMFSSH